MTPEQLFAGVQHEPGALWLDGGPRHPHRIAIGPDLVTQDADDWAEAARGMHAPGALVAGYIGFGAGQAWVSDGPSPEPPVHLARYRDHARFDPATGRWEVWGQRLAARLDTDTAPLGPPPPASPTLADTVSRAGWLEACEEVLDYLRSGDCYQINLSRPVWVADAGTPWPAYRRVRAANPARCGAFLRTVAGPVVLCNSPELLLQVADRRLTSTPIKGTAPRDPDPERDAELRTQLLESIKDRAELAMIVDLVRHDLGSVATLGSVTVGPRHLTDHAHVHHAAQTVRAILQTDRDGWHALGAMLPPGSVTGAPKRRATQRIGELEPNPRGVYCGAIGYLDDASHGQFNVAIRTAVFDGDQARYHVGGGIVIRSDPQAEWEETEHKGRALARALGVTPR